MATIHISPAPLNLSGVAGDPFAVTLTVTAKTETGATIPWATLTDPVVVVTNRGATDTAAYPTVTSPESGKWLLTWSTAETAAIGRYPSMPWSLSCTIQGSGPNALVAGSISMAASTQPGTSSSTSASLAVTVGPAEVSVTVTTGGSAGVTSFNNRTGPVEPESGDYTYEMVGADEAGSAATAQSNAEEYATGLTTAERERAEGVEATKAPFASPALTGTPTAPTAAAGTDTTQVATTAFVHNSPGALLALVNYAPASTTTYASSSKTLAAVDTTNLAISFTAPPSGRVLVRLSALAVIASANVGAWWGLLDATTGNLYGSAVMVTNSDSVRTLETADIVVTGLVSGTSYTMNWALARGTTSGSVRIVCHTMGKTITGITGGPAVMEVIAA